MLDWLFGKPVKTQLLDMMGKGNVGYLSATCCNPAAATSDNQLVANLEAAMKNLGQQHTIYKETLTGAQSALPGIAGQLSDAQKAVAQKVMTLFSTQGLMAFPIVFMDGDIVFYGGVPSVNQIEDAIRAKLGAEAASVAN